MATECYSGTYPLPLPTLTATCPPDDGICFSSLSLGEGQHTAQFGCWPSLTAAQLGWYGVPECKHEVGRQVCLCLQSLCNRLPPSPREMHPEWGEVQGLTLLFMILVFLAFLVGVACFFRKYVKRSFVRECIVVDVEHGDHVFEMVSLHNQSAIDYIQDQSHMVSLRYQSPSSPLFHESSAHSSQDSPAPTLVRRNSAPGSMSSPGKTTYD
jgi:hypothetical protein